MEYISAVEAAEKWGVSLRQVQRLLASGRIPDTKRYGRSWMIPAGAEKPDDLRREKQQATVPALPSGLAYMLEATARPAPKDSPDAILAALSEERLHFHYEGGLAYLRGDFEQVLRCFQKVDGDDAAKLCDASLAIAAAVSAGDYPLYTTIEGFLKGIERADASAEVTAFAQLSLSTAYLGAMAPNMVPAWLKEGNFSALPPQARPEAAHLRAKYFQCACQYESMLAVAQTALAFCDSRDMTSSHIYLSLMCAVACNALGRADEAQRWLLDIMRIVLPHGFITPFAELLPVMGGLVEECLEREFPAYYDDVIDQCRRTMPNWIAFHNRFTKDNVTAILSLREFQIAALAARGVPNGQIAAQFHISVGRLKTILHEIYGKLLVNNRKELSRFIL